MTRINTNVPSLVAQNRLQASNGDLQTALTRLSTGLRINSGADDPAGLIASEALRSEVTSLGRAISNTRRASQIISTADSALGQVSALLNDVRGLVVEAANNGALSKEEIAANQLQIDSSLEAINRIAQTTTFQGRKLLDGSMDFVSSANSVASVLDANIDQANLGATGQIDVEVLVTSAATQAAVTSSGFSAAAQATAESPEETFRIVAINGQNFEITGPTGLTDIDFTDTDADTGAIAAAYAAGTLSIDGDFTGGGASATNSTNADILAALNGVDGITARIAGGTELAAAVPADITGITNARKLSIVANTAGSEYNDIEIRYVDADDAGAADTATASFDAQQKILTVNYNSAASTPTNYTAIANAINTVTVDGSQAFTATADTDAGNFAFLDPPTELTSTGKTGGEVLLDDLIFQLNGANGADTFNFGAGTSQDQVAAAVNLVSDSTGISAETNDAGQLQFTSTAYGSEALVHIDVIDEGASGTFESGLSSARAIGDDIQATVNGIEAGGRANTLAINTSSLDLSITVEDGSSTNFSFSITGGGALFQLGPDVTSNQQARMGIGSVSTGQLGGADGRLYELGSGQAKSLVNDVNGASRLIDDVINKVTSLRGRLGAFQSTSLESNLISLNDTLANLQEAESSIRDADFAQESANLTRAQILVQSGTNVLSLANQSPQNVLSLLR